MVVGGGLSGLAAAHFFRQQAGPTARILILDNHDDFGGHAKRNEFSDGGRTVIGYGGSFSIDSPAPYSAAAKGLMKELGVDVVAVGHGLRQAAVSVGGHAAAASSSTARPSARTAAASPPSPTPAARAGRAAALPGDAWPGFLEKAPLSADAKRDLLRLYRDKADHMPGLSAAQKKARLARMSYADYLTRTMGLHKDVLPFLQARTHGLYGAGIDAVPAQDAWALGLPGFAGLGLDPAPGRGMNRDAIPNAEAADYFFHFPDGNATLARLLVRGLIPAAVPGRTADDVVTARARLRAARRRGRARAHPAEQHRRARAAPRRPRHRRASRSGLRARRQAADGARPRVVLACWNMVIPYLCPELPAAQKEALAYAVKVPLVYTNVLLRNWTAFQKLGVRRMHCPGSYHTTVNLDMPVSVGAYRSARTAGGAGGRPSGAHAVQPGPARAAAAPRRPPRAADHAPSRPSSGRSATSSRACWAPAASTPPATSPPSP